MTVERRQWVFGGLAVLALGAMVWVLMRPADGTGASGAAVTPQTRARSAAREQPPAGPPAPVQLSALEAGREQPVESPRNPFRFQPKVAPAPPRPAAPPPGNLPPAATAPAGPPQAPPIALKFIGVVEKADGLKLAVLTDGKVTLYGREGDIIDGRYRVLKIGVESIEVAYADGRGRQTIRLTGQ
jgi:hypothetical protein